MTPEERDALIRIRDAGGSADVFLFDPDVRANLVRMGLVNCTAARTIVLTWRGERIIKEGEIGNG